MKYELNILDSTKSEKTLLEECFAAIEFGVTKIFTSSYYCGKLKSFLPKNIFLSCPVNFPYGMSESLLCQHECISAINHGASTIDLIINPIFLINKQRDKLRKDIRSIIDICNRKDVQLNAMLDYRTYSDRILYVLCDFLDRLGISTIIPSTGQFVDDYIDNIIVCEMIKSKFQIDTIYNGTFLTTEQFLKIKKTNIKTLRLRSFYNLVGV